MSSPIIVEDIIESKGNEEGISNDENGAYINLVKIGLILMTFFGFMCFFSWKRYNKALKKLDTLKLRSTANNNNKKKS